MKNLTKKMKIIFSVFVHELKYCLNLLRLNQEDEKEYTDQRYRP